MEKKQKSQEREAGERGKEGAREGGRRLSSLSQAPVTLFAEQNNPPAANTKSLKVQQTELKEAGRFAFKVRV